MTAELYTFRLKRSAMRNWDLVGEDASALVHPGHLPLDWRTVACALLSYEHDTDRAAAEDVWTSLEWGEKAAIVKHAWEVWAPPGEWYDGTYYTWHQPQEDVPGWATLGEQSVDGCECGYDEVVCLGLDKWDQGIIRTVADALAGEPTIRLIAPGEGWPWLSRIINPATVVLLDA